MLRWISRNHPAVFLHLVLGGGIAEVMVADAALVVKCIAVITAGIRRSCMLYQLVGAGTGRDNPLTIGIPLDYAFFADFIGSVEHLRGTVLV